MTSVYAINGTFSADNDASAYISVPPGQTIYYSLTSSALTGSVTFEKAGKGFQSWSTLQTVSATGGAVATGDVEYRNTTKEVIHLRLHCLDLNVGGGESVDWVLGEVATDPIWRVDDSKGNPVIEVTEAGIETSLAPLTTVGLGAKNGATVTATEYGDGIMHKTVLTLASTPVSVVSVGANAGVGGTKIYDLPEGRILVLGCMADLSLAIAVAKQGDFTDGTPEGDIGVGTVAPANADALGTDSTDDDFSTATAFTMNAYAASADVPSEPTGQMDGTATAKDVYVNLLVDAADIDNDVTTQVLVSGTVTFHWINLGDF